jgi:hypothetical protein
MAKPGSICSFVSFDFVALGPGLTRGFRNGHGCMLQYALLHLYGYDVSMDDLKDFRVSTFSGFGQYH